MLLQAKNAALKEAGAVVPDSFEALEGAIKATYDRLVAEGVLVPQPDVPAPDVPMDLEAAKKAGKVLVLSMHPRIMESELIACAGGCQPLPARGNRWMRSCR
jgi:hypothetical protein